MLHSSPQISCRHTSLFSFFLFLSFHLLSSFSTITLFPIFSDFLSLLPSLQSSHFLHLFFNSALLFLVFNFLFQFFKSITPSCVSHFSCSLFTFSSWMRRYWFYVKNDFRNFHHIFTF